MENVLVKPNLVPKDFPVDFLRSLKLDSEILCNDEETFIKLQNLLRNVDLTAAILNELDEETIDPIDIADRRAAARIKSKRTREFSKQIPITDQKGIQIYVGAIDQQTDRNKTNNTAKIIRKIATAILEFSQGDNTRTEEAISSINAGITDIGHAWVMGFPQDNPIEPVTLALLEELSGTGKESSAQAIARVLFRKAMQDINLFQAIRYPTSPGQFEYATVEGIQKAMNQLIGLSLDAGHEGLVAIALDVYRQTLDNQDLAFLYEISQQVIILPSIIENQLKYLPKVLSSNTIHWYTKDFKLEGLPQEDNIELVQLSLWSIAVVTTSGVLVYNIIPYNSSSSEENTIFPEKNQNLIMGFTSEEMPDDETLKSFLGDLPKIREQVAASFSGNFNFLQYHPVVFFHLWEQQGRQPELDEITTNFLSEFGETGINLLTNGSFSTQEYKAVMRFLLDTRSIPLPDTTPAADGQEVYYPPDNLASWYLLRLSEVDNLAVEYSESSIEDLEQRAQTRDLLYQQTKSLLLTAARFQQQNGTLSAQEIAFTQQALAQQRLLIADLLYPGATNVKGTRTRINSLRKFALNPALTNNADSQRVFRLMMASWFNDAVISQKKAPYHGRVDEMASEFYQVYVDIAHDPEKTTVNRAIEMPRYTASFQTDRNTGLIREVSQDDPYRVLYAGCGDLSRLEVDLIALLEEELSHVVSVGSDPFPPDEMPPQLESLLQLTLQELAQQPELAQRFDRIYMPASPLMEVIEYDKLIEAIAGIIHVMKIEGIVETDNAFFFGENGYEALASEHVQQFPDQPESVFHRTWETADGIIFGKYFGGADPRVLIPLAQTAGLEAVNFPNDIRAVFALCQLISYDDSIFEISVPEYMEQIASDKKIQGFLTENNILKEELQGWLEQAKPSFYRTQDKDRKYNRWMLKLQKVGEPSVDFSSLLQRIIQ